MCPLCSSEKFQKVGLPKTEPKAEKLIKKSYLVVQCENCEFYYVDPPIEFTQEEWNVLYDDSYFFKMTAWHEQERMKQMNSRLSQFEKLSGKNIGNYLDVGCGEGYTLLLAKQKGWHAHGVDIADNRVKDAKADDINFINSDLISADYPDNFFDAVYMDSVLEHVPNPLEYLHELQRIMAPGGLLYIGLPNEDSLVNDFRQLVYSLSGKDGVSARLRPFEAPYHISGFNNNSLRYAINKASLKIVKLRNFATKMEFLKAPFLSKAFIADLILFPTALAAVPLRKEVYFEAYLQK